MLGKAFLRFFKYFGFFPFKRDSDENFVLKKIQVIFVVIFVCLFWTILTDSLLSNTIVIPDKLSMISNLIQLLVKSFSLTLILLSPIGCVKTVNEISSRCKMFDTRMREIGFKINQKRINIAIAIIFISHLSFLLYMGSFEVYALLVRFDSMHPIYWFLTFLPTVIQTMALCFSICLLHTFFYRLTLIKDRLKTYQQPHEKYFLSIERKINEKMLKTIFLSYNDLLELGHLIEDFFGTIFFASIASIFVITTIQIYYCYVLISSEKLESFGYSTWTLIVAINEIFLNLATLVLLTRLCEMINNQVNEEFR
jgi:gustatory receptor